jgi:integrase/recombinase XerD
MKWSRALKDYKHYLKIERGLSQNSIASYELDIEKIIHYIDQNQIAVTPIDMDYEEVQNFIYDVSKHLNARSQSRLISGLRSFFNYLVFEDYRKTNPLDQIESPKIGRKLPDTLSLNDIDRLITAIDLSKTYNGINIGERNRAIV